MKTAPRALLIFAVLVGCVGCDQATKAIARQSLAGAAPMSFLNDLVRLQYAENRGGFLSLGAGIPDHWRYGIFTLAVGLALAAGLVYLISSKKVSLPQSLAVALMVGGGIGNLIDRIFNEGRVVDFLNLGIGPVRTGVFNVADLAISLGCLWLLAVAFMERGKES